MALGNWVLVAITVTSFTLSDASLPPPGGGVVHPLRGRRSGTTTTAATFIVVVVVVLLSFWLSRHEV
jgi:hypothetical protein